MWKKMVPVCPSSAPSAAPAWDEQQQKNPSPPAWAGWGVHPSQQGMLQCRRLEGARGGCANYGQVTPLAESMQTAAWIPRSDVLRRKVRRVFLHHVSDPDEEKGVTTISSIYGHGEVGLSSPALLQWDPSYHKWPQGQQVPVPRLSGALLDQSCPTGHAGLEGCRDPAAAEKGGPAQRGASTVVHPLPTTPTHAAHLHIPFGFFFFFFPLLFPLLKGKKSKRCLANRRMLPHPLHALQQWCPAVP